MERSVKCVNHSESFLVLPVRLVAVKKSLEALQMFTEALCQCAEVVQSAES